MTPFLKNGILGMEYGFIIPVTSEDPSLVVLESNPTENKPNWGIAVFLGNECIGLINNQTDFSLIHKSVLTMPVVTRNGVLKGSVAERINAQFKAFVI